MSSAGKELESVVGAGCDPISSMVRLRFLPLVVLEKDDNLVRLVGELLLFALRLDTDEEVEECCGCDCGCFV